MEKYSICYTKISDRLLYDIENILHENELRQASQYGSKRKIEFAAGRLAAKRAYLLLTGQNIALSQILIDYDCFGAPFYMDAGYACSISHDRVFAIAAAFDIKMQRIGIDIQNRGSIKRQLIHYFVNDKEGTLLKDWLTFYNEDYLYTAVWCAKEGMSKLLQYGYGIFGLLEIESMKVTQNSLVIMFSKLRNLCVSIYEMGDSLIAVASGKHFLHALEQNPIQFQEIESIL